jgi:trehalose-6-phosphatase
MSVDDLISPFDESVQEQHKPAARLDSLSGRRVTLLSISKPKSAEFLEELEAVLAGEHGAVVRRAHKPTFTTPAPAEIYDEVARTSDAVVEALAD